MGVQRYLIKFSYFGTHFRGVQILKRKIADYKTVLGVIETGLRYLYPANNPVSFCASRTDAGVHALCNYFHVDLVPRPGRQPFSPSAITSHLNDFLYRAKLPCFHARWHVTRRQYLYRLAMPVCDSSPSNVFEGRAKKFAYVEPLAELHKAYFLGQSVDVSKMERCCSLLQREANFSSFSSLGVSQTGYIKDPFVKLEKVALTPGRPLSDPALDESYHNLRFIDLHFASDSFLYHQIRKCVGIIVGFAQGRVTEHSIEEMFSNPNHSNYPSCVKVAPPDGLFLAKVEYPPHVLQPDFLPPVEEMPPLYQGEERARVTNRARLAIMSGYTGFSHEQTPVDVLAQRLTQANLVDSGTVTQSTLAVDADDTVPANESNRHVRNGSGNDNLLVKNVAADTTNVRNLTTCSPKSQRAELYRLIQRRNSLDDEIELLMQTMIRSSPMNEIKFTKDAIDEEILRIISEYEIAQEGRQRKALSEQLVSLNSKHKRKSKNKKSCAAGN